jgi:hypothetical protein
LFVCLRKRTNKQERVSKLRHDGKRTVDVFEILYTRRTESVGAASSKKDESRCEFHFGGDGK